MSLEKHNLVSEFPEHREKIQRLKTSNGHFARLYQEYDAVEHSVHRIESGAEAASDERLEDLKKQRIALKDQLFSMMQESA